MHAAPDLLSTDASQAHSGVQPTCRRGGHRTNTFVMASLIGDSCSVPIRIRNLSASGAMLSGPDLPLVGERVLLRRGSLSVAAKVIRRADQSAGVKFERPIAVETWLMAGHERQRDADRTIQQAKHMYPVADTAIRLGERIPSTMTRTDDLAAIADRLDRLADALSGDPAVIARYMDQLQVLDLASQKLRALR